MGRCYFQILYDCCPRDQPGCVCFTALSPERQPPLAFLVATCGGPWIRQRKADDIPCRRICHLHHGRIMPQQTSSTEGSLRQHNKGRISTFVDILSPPDLAFMCLRRALICLGKYCKVWSLYSSVSIARTVWNSNILTDTFSSSVGTFSIYCLLFWSVFFLFVDRKNGRYREVNPRELIIRESWVPQFHDFFSIHLECCKWDDTASGNLKNTQDDHSRSIQGKGQIKQIIQQRKFRMFASCHHNSKHTGAAVLLFGVIWNQI